MYWALKKILNILTYRKHSEGTKKIGSRIGNKFKIKMASTMTFNVW
jgi:hypothetical protein